MHAILFAFDHGWFSLWVESDSILAIQTIQKHIQIVLGGCKGFGARYRLFSLACALHTLTSYGKAIRRRTLWRNYTLMKFGLE
ncbi:hypothetical protein ACS0TY_010814 [Phlomoides rotata]